MQAIHRKFNSVRIIHARINIIKNNEEERGGGASPSSSLSSSTAAAGGLGHDCHESITEKRINISKDVLNISQHGLCEWDNTEPSAQ